MSREVMVDGARFRVFHADTRAEAHRQNVDFRIARAEMMARGVAAIALATGCTVRMGTVEGDQAVIRARVSDCPVP